MNKYINKRICFLLSVMVMSTSSRGDDVFTDGTLLVKESIEIKTDPSLKELAEQLSEQCGITVCYEYSLDESERGLSEILKIGSERPMTVRDIMLALKENGYNSTVLNKALLVYSSGVKDINDNPMDLTFNDFSFEGGRMELERLFQKEGIHVCFMNKPMAGDREMYTSFPLPGSIDMHYEIKIEGTVSLRDILLNIASEYDCGWYAEVRRNETIKKITAEDGTVSCSWNGKMFLTFFDER